MNSSNYDYQISTKYCSVVTQQSGVCGVGKQNNQPSTTGPTPPTGAILDGYSTFSLALKMRDSKALKVCSHNEGTPN